MGFMTLLYAGKPPAVASSTTLDPANTHADITLSNGNLTALQTGGAGFRTSRTVASYSSGKKYFKATWDNTTSDPGFGFGNSSTTTNNYLGSSINSVGYHNDSNVYQTGGANTTYTTGDVTEVAFDIGAQLIWVRKNSGNWNNNGSADPATGTGGFSTSYLGAGPYYGFICLQGNPGQVTLDFSGSTAPSGFSGL